MKNASASRSKIALWLLSCMPLLVSSVSLAQQMPTDDDCVEKGGKTQCTAPVESENKWGQTPFKPPY